MEISAGGAYVATFFVAMYAPVLGPRMKAHPCWPPPSARMLHSRRRDRPSGPATALIV